MMTNDELLHRYKAHYLPALSKFVETVKGIDGAGIPEPHLPLWGSNYASSEHRLAFIGRDTLSWGDMNSFVEALLELPIEAIHRNQAEFDTLAFTGWTNNFGNTFWDTVLQILAGINELEDWKLLKRREVTAPLKSFMWAETNTVELYQATPSYEGVDPAVWRKFKDASEEHLDSFTQLMDTFRPHAVVMMHWDPGPRFLDAQLDWKDYGSYQSHAYYEPTKTQVFAMQHPGWMNRNGLHAEAVQGVVERIRQLIFDRINVDND